MIGAIWFVYLLGYNMSVAVWVGIIALAGVDAETGVIMLLYLDQAYEKWRGSGRMRNMEDLREAIAEGAVKRIRPNDDRHGNSLRFVADHVEPRRGG
jgi:Cu(I)/Ag(I) efflux system membrane protein CusA/SilA